ncbi:MULTISPECIES: TIGR02285 family protein [Pseudomonas]|uniref:TIGR02285 family protein n=1 Tax=Pseudomonas gingeri TaxID=117681 RepID=A0A7Y8BKD5_9PSED|nr:MULTISPECIES: TIGR02285 family protein [Pseudomonas]MCU1738696.1 TIGR02285 family protein [Pseudomonas sp. 20S_6.2_Bac1]NWB46934.1 TIGR02285 family protein [Pseudomonas gingeri]
MSPRILWQHVLCRRPALALLAVFACALPTGAEAKDTLIWLLRDLPPLTIFDGPQKGQGAIDQLRPLLVAAMPEYEHVSLRVNRARATQMLSEPSFTCDPMLLWTADRAKKMVFSIPSIGQVSNVLVVRQADRPLIEPFVRDGQVDLAALLGSDHPKLGIVAERSYGPLIDELLRRTPAERLAAHYGNDALGSLLQMQRLGRLTALLGYWTEIRYLARQQGIATEDLVSYPIKGVEKYQFIRVGCSDTEQGRMAITHINRILRELRQHQLVEFYAQWLDPQQRDSYREDARQFFLAPEDQ